MTRREFPTKVKVAAFKRANGRCEGRLADGTLCYAVLVPGRWQADHDNPDGLTGAPTIDNCRCLCLHCHGHKSRSDVQAIAQAKRRESAHVSARAAPKRPIKSAGFPKGQRREPKPRLPPRQLYVAASKGRET